MSRSGPERRTDLLAQVFVVVAAALAILLLVGGLPGLVDDLGSAGGSSADGTPAGGDGDSPSGSSSDDVAETTPGPTPETGATERPGASTEEDATPTSGPASSPTAEGATETGGPLVGLGTETNATATATVTPTATPEPTVAPPTEAPTGGSGDGGGSGDDGSGSDTPTATATVPVTPTPDGTVTPTATPAPNETETPTATPETTPVPTAAPETGTVAGTPERTPTPTGGTPTATATGAPAGDDDSDDDGDDADDDDGDDDGGDDDGDEVDDDGDEDDNPSEPARTATPIPNATTTPIPESSDVFEFTDAGPIDPRVRPGDTIMVGYEVHNLGAETATQVVKAGVDVDGDGELESDEVVDSREITLESGAGAGAGFELTVPESLDTGLRNWTAVTGTQQTTSSLYVTRPGDALWLRDPHPTDPTVYPNETFEVSFDAFNGWDQEVTQTVEVRVDTDRDGTFEASETVESRAVTVGVGSERPTFDLTVPESLSPDQYEWAAFTGSQQVVGEFTVAETPTDVFFFTGTGPIDRNVSVGDTYRYGYDVANGVDAPIETTQVVEARLDADRDGEFEASEAIDSREMTIYSGVDVGVRLAYVIPESLDPGRYEWAAVTGSEVAGGNYIFVEAPETDVFEFTEAGPIDPTVDPGETFRIGYEVTNTGTERATQTVEVRADFDGDGTFEEPLDNREVTLDSGVGRGVGVNLTVPESADPGEYEWVARTGSRETGAEFTVATPATPTATATATPSPTSTPTATATVPPTETETATSTPTASASLALLWVASVGTLWTQRRR